MADAEQEGFDAAVAPAEDVDRAGVKVVEQRGEVVGHFLVGDLVGAVARAALVAAVHGDDFVVLAEVGDLCAETTDAGAVAVD
jgi:hypothetical protein